MVRNRALFVLVCAVSAILIGCSGGGGGGGGGPVPTLAPTVKPTATPRVTPTPSAIASANPVASRPLASGATFTYAGTSLESFTYHNASPNPNGTIADAIAQTVTDEGTAAFDGADPSDLRVAETDHQQSPARTSTVTTDAYFAAGSFSASQTGFYTYGYASSDSLGQRITDRVASVGDSGGISNGLIDVLPETGGQIWGNTAAQTIVESESDGFSATRTYAANGTYVETDAYPQGSQFTPQPSPLPASIIENADGSGTYSVPLYGATPNASFAYAAPAAGTITITYAQPGSANATYTVATWYALPLYRETDRDDGARPIPAACNVPAQFGSSANAIEQQFTRADTVLGTLETFDAITYVVGGYVVCTAMTDVVDVFYDYSGQGNEPPTGATFSGGTSPLEVITMASTVGLTSTNVSGAARGRATAPAADGLRRAAVVRTSFLAGIERRRLERRVRRQHD